jgi:hypothetical protein
VTYSCALHPTFALLKVCSIKNAPRSYAGTLYFEEKIDAFTPFVFYPEDYPAAVLRFHNVSWD